MATNTIQPGAASANPSRRSALGILATAPIAVLPALAVTQCSTPAHAAHDPEIAFGEWKASIRAIENSTSDEVPDHLWHRRETAEDAIDNQRASSIRAAEIGLWVGLRNMVMMRTDQDAILREDMAYFLDDRADYDGEAPMVIATIAALRKLGGR